MIFMNFFILQIIIYNLVKFLKYFFHIFKYLHEFFKIHIAIHQQTKPFAYILEFSSEIKRGWNLLLLFISLSSILM